MNKINNKILYLIIALFTFIIYYNALQNDFAFDDESVILGNSSITSLSNIPKFFFAQEGFHKVIGRYYRPVVSSTYNIDYAIWQFNPFGYHLTNILIHIIATLLLFALLLNIFKDYRNKKIISLICTLIFAVHPIHTEAVSWVSGRTDSLVTLFFFAALLFYIKYTDNNSLNKNTLLLSVIFYIFSLLSKEMSVTFPVVIILYDYFVRKYDFKSFRKNFNTYIIFITITVFYLLIRYLVLKDVVERNTYMYFYGKDFITAFSTMLKTLPIYAKLLFFPVNLLYHYNGVYSDSISMFEPAVLFSLLFIVVLIISAVVIRKKFGLISFVILFFFISLLPVMNIIPTMNFMAERFLYITSFAFCLLAGYIIYRTLNKNSEIIVYSVSVIVIIIFSFLTYQRNKDWKDNNTLYSTAMDIDGSVLLVNAGNIFANNKNYTEAAKRYRRALEIRSNSVLANHNLGLTFLIANELDSAEFYIKKGISIDSLAPDGYLQLANIYQRRNNLSEAIIYLEKLQTIVPNYHDSQRFLDELRMQSSMKNVPDTSTSKNANKTGESLILDKQAYELYQKGEFKEAIKLIEKQIQLNPEGESGYLNNMGLCYEGLNDLNTALEKYLKAIKIDSKNINALGGAANAHLKKGNITKAKEYYSKILEINPSEPNAKSKLDSLNKISK